MNLKDIQISPRMGDIVGAAIFIAVAIAAYLISRDFLPPVLPGDPGAAFFPRLIVSVMLLFSIILIVQRVRRRHAETDKASVIGVDVASFSVTVFSVLGLIVVMAYVGFEPAAVGFLFILLGWRTGRWLWALVVSVVAMLLMYLTFVALLKVQLPMLFLPKYIYL